MTAPQKVIRTMARQRARKAQWVWNGIHFCPGDLSKTDNHMEGIPHGV